ncbi:hypothetical protein [Spirosoma areae]
MQEYVERQARLDLLSLFGKVQWDGDLEQMRTDETPNNDLPILHNDVDFDQIARFTTSRIANP